jgi:hypothetical protein
MLEAMARIAPSKPNEAMVRIVPAAMVPFHSTQAAGSKFPRKALWSRFDFFLKGPNRYKKRIRLGFSRKGVAIHESSPEPMITRSV